MNTQKKLQLAFITSMLLSTSMHSYADGANNAAENIPVTVKLVDSLIKLADGPHKGYRANHAKGVMAEGIFEPSPDARVLSKAAHLQNVASKVTARLSNATGVPNKPDASPNAHPHGIALRFELPDGATTDIVSISINSFPAATPEEFLELLKSVEASGSGSGKPSPVETFLASHPAAARFVAPRPAPTSFANTQFYGVNAFKFTNAEGKTAYGRYLITPLEGVKNLSVEEASNAAQNYLMDEIVGHLASSEIKYQISVQIAEDADVVNDATVTWPDSRKVIVLGLLTIKSPIENSKVAEKHIMFNPLNLLEGIEPSADPILLARPPAYAVSYAKRLAE